LFETSEADIAVAAKKASDFAGGVAVVNMKVMSISSRRSAVANCTASVLLCEQPIISAERDAVGRFQLVVFGQSRMRFAPLFRVQRSVFEVFASPFFVTFEVAFAAVDRIAVDGVARLSKLREWLGLFALGAFLFPERRVETFARHVSTF